jgi:predicted PP-loop superfamily ATPase
MTRPIEHDKVRDALFFQLEPILSAFERAYHIDPEDSFEAIYILEKLLEERLKIEKGYDDKKIEDFKKHAELEMNRLKPRASNSVWK